MLLVQIGILQVVNVSQVYMLLKMVHGLHGHVQKLEKQCVPVLVFSMGEKSVLLVME